MKSKRAVKWAKHKAAIRAKKRLSDTGIGISVETPEATDQPKYQETLWFASRCLWLEDKAWRGFPVSLEDAERFAREILEMVALVRKRLAKESA